MTIATRQAASGIRFNDCLFSEPVSFANWIPPGYPGLFAILTFDPNWAPRPLRALYFGEVGNNTPAHLLWRDCSRVLSTADGKNLFISIFPMPFTTRHNDAPFAMKSFPPTIRPARQAAPLRPRIWQTK